MAIVREQVLADCIRSENALGPSFFDQHLAVVAAYAVTLAERLGANGEVVELASYLHDISAVRDIETLPRHAAASAGLAARLLRHLGYPEPGVLRVTGCIASHSSPLPLGGGTPEEVCVSNADAMSQIARPAYWLFFATRVRKSGFEEGRQWLLSRVEANWASLIEPAKALVKDRYELAKTLLQQ